MPLLYRFLPKVISWTDRPTILIPQIQRNRVFEYDLAVDGCRQMLWGLFKKVVLVFGPVYRGSGEVVVTDDEEKMYDYFIGQASLYDFPILNYMQLDMCKTQEFLIMQLINNII